VLDYDDVMNAQRKAVYGLRDQVLLNDDCSGLVNEAIDDVVHTMVDEHIPESVQLDEFEPDELLTALKNHFKLDSLTFAGESFDGIFKHLSTQIRDAYAKRFNSIITSLVKAAEAQGGAIDEASATNRWRFFERERYLRSIDTLWKHHLKIMESLREGIHLESYAQKDPKIEYKKQGKELFDMMMVKISENVTEALFRAEGPTEAEIEAMRRRRLEEEQRVITNREAEEAAAQAQQKAAQKQQAQQQQQKQQAPPPTQLSPAEAAWMRQIQKTGRNDVCPCGSGQKYKKCHEGKEVELLGILMSRGGPAPAAQA
jgi:preprotein translocase subunit SecA